MGPAWARAVVAGLPGVVVASPTEVTCPARGLRWKVPGGPGGEHVRHGLAAAMSLAAPTTEDGLDADEHARICASAQLGHKGPWLPARRERDGWAIVAHGARVTVTDGSVRDVRWPCAEDAWLLERVGPGEPLPADDDPGA